MKNVRVKVESPLLLPTGYVHTGTTYLLNKKIDFTNETELLVNDKNDTVNLTEKKFTIDMVKGEPIYLVTRYEYTDTLELQSKYDSIPVVDVSVEDRTAFTTAMGSNDYASAITIVKRYVDYTPSNPHSSYSRITPLLGDQEDLTISDTMVVTPKLNITMDFDSDDAGRVVANSTDFKIFAGAGNHSSTTWEVFTIDGVLMDSRKKDTSNLTSYPLPDNITNADNFAVRCFHHSDTGAVSYGGCVINTSVSKYTGLFNVIQEGSLVVTRPLYFKVSLNTFNFASLQLRVIGVDGKVVTTIDNIKHLGPNIETDTFIFGKEYSFEFRLTLTNGVITEPIILKDIANKAPVVYDDTKTYLDKYDFKHLLMTDGKTSNFVHQLYNKSILVMKNGSKSISLFKYVDDSLIDVGELIELGVDDDMYSPDVYVNQLKNGDVIVAYSSRDTEDAGSVFINTYSFNPISNKLGLKNSYQTDVRFGLAFAGSVTTTWSNYVFYIEAGDVDHSARLVKYNPYDGSVSKIDLDMINSKTNICIVRDLNDDIVILGGSDDFRDKEENVYTTRTNDKVIKFNTTLNTFVEVGTDLLTGIDNHIVRMHAVVRHDGAINLFNNTNTENIDIVGNQSTYTLSVKDESLLVLDNDHDDTLPYVNSIVLLNGDVLRFTSIPKDPQKLYGYITNTMKASEIDDNDSVAINPNELVAGDGVVLTEHDLIKYDVVRAEGTGIIKYPLAAGTVNIDSATLVVTRDLVLERSIYNASKYNKYISLDGVQFIIKG